MKIDEIDVLILDELRKDSRQSMRELSKRINLSAPSVTERVKKLESEGIIQGYSIKVNYKALGLKIECILEITVKNGDYKKFQKLIQDFPNIVFCYRIAGHACYIAKLRVSTLEEIEVFINDITPVASTVTHIIFSEVSIERPIRDLLKNKNSSNT